MIRQTWEPTALTPVDYDKRRRGRAISITGVDTTLRPAIPLFEMRRQSTPGGGLVVPILTDVLVRATVPRSLLNDLPQDLRGRVFEDVVISLPPDPDVKPRVGTANDVADLLDLAGLNAAGMTGKNVVVGIVDNGINVSILKKRYLSQLPACSETPPCFGFDKDLSSGSKFLGASPTNNGITHGGMVAFGVLIAAPHVTLADIVLSGGGTARVGDAIEAYTGFALKLALRKLQGRPAPAGVVLVNSWGILNPALDDPESLYIKNPSHIFSVVISGLADMGIDIVFAAGNCGVGGNADDCGTLGRTIYGANGYERVVTVAAANTKKEYLDYSSQGPGWIFERKPDVTGFAGFQGFFPVDRGTSAAAPTVAGLVAAYRSKHPFSFAEPRTSVDAMRDRIIRSVDNCHAPGATPPHDVARGSGVVNGHCLVLEDALDSGSN